MSADKHGSKKPSIRTKKVIEAGKTKTAETAEKKALEKQKKVDEQAKLLREPNKVSKDPKVKRRMPVEPSKSSITPTSTAAAASKKSTSQPAGLSKRGKSTTSPTSRVEKSQYFPSKNLYSNALKSLTRADQPVPVPVKKATVKRPASITKGSHAAIPSDTTKTKRKALISRELSPERPRTATLKRGSIVNYNIVGPEAPQPSSSSRTDEADDPDYEDDFESYESDFEPDTSSDDINLPDTVSSSSAEELSDKKLTPPPSPSPSKVRLSSAGTDDERKLDSGTFELSEFKHRQILRYIEDTIRKEDAIIEHDGSREACNHVSLSDEGFEDQKSLQFVNFAAAKRKCEQRRLSAARKKRGEELLGMIKLDAINFTVLDLPAVPYDVFIANYGRSDTIQASVQTGEDNLCEEVQTDAIDQEDKWTQMPVKFSTFDQSLEGFWSGYKCEFLGVGGSKVARLNETDHRRLIAFTKQSGELMLQILSEQSMKSCVEQDVAGRKNNLPFSNGYLQFDTGNTMFGTSAVRSLAVNSRNIRYVLTVHVELDRRATVKSLVCVWDIGNVNAPAKVLKSFGEVSCCTFWFNDFVIAGQTDGLVCLWSLKSKEHIYDLSSGTPSFVTPLGLAHLAKVACVTSTSNSSTIEDAELYTLDELGLIITWSVYDVSLIKTREIDLHQQYPDMRDMLCTDLIATDGHLYVSTNYGFILHCLQGTNSRGAVKKHSPERNVEATCLETCPFSALHFVAGGANGDVSLYFRTREKPLLVLQTRNEDKAGAIQIVEWSRTKPFVLYTADSNDTIHVWDLRKSDIYSEYSIRFPERINCLKLSPGVNVEQREAAYMLIGTENGNIYLHLLNKEHDEETTETYQKHVAIFLNYLSRL